MRIKVIALISVIFAIADFHGGAWASAPIVLLTPDARDVHSYARPEIARVTNVDLDLKVDFDARTLAGTATLDIHATRNANEIVLDTSGLNIQAVHDGGGRKLPWSLGATDEILGAPLKVTIGKARRIVVQYSTAPDVPALQWLAPEQTAGRTQPFLYSQGQSIHTRNWVPTQDSPGIRQTWSARIVAPAKLRVVMSAEMLTPQGEAVAPGLRSWRFRMNRSVPPYLIAIAVGDLGFKPLGPRTGVYSEPASLDAAAAELSDLERMIDIAEALYGPYRFGRYDVLLMPPSFPLGGMENTRLTFVTPLLITGDRSRMWVIVHEFAHAWASALVTNATWADLWLNEGMTQYFSVRILERLYGPQFAGIQSDLDWSAFMRYLPAIGGMSSPDTRLYLDLAGRNPDDAMNPVGTEKGAAFLRTVEAAVGRERFDAYLRSYFERFAFQPQTTARFVEDLRVNLIKGDAALERRIEIERWVYDAGVPDSATHTHSEILSQAEARATQFAKAGALDGTDAVAASTWSTPERVRFLNSLPRQLSREKLSELERTLGLTRSANSDARFAWLRLVISNRYEPALPVLDDYLAHIGNRASVTTLFRDLVAQGDWGRAYAERVYAKARPGYHSMTRESVDRILAPTEIASP
ncbi:MAG: M1 family metallopeptidase [Steroidobacteraceae bacterium]